MKIELVTIKHFRSIENCTLRFDQILALVGANNVGKSNIMRALNAFFNYNEERDAFLNEEHLYSRRSRPTIIVTFCDIQEKDVADPAFISNGKLTVKFIYRWDRKTPYYQVLGDNGKQFSISSESFNQLLKNFTFIYVPIIRNYDAAFSEEGIAYLLLKKIFEQLTAKRNNLQPIAERFKKQVEKSIYSLSTSQISSFYPLSNEHQFIMHTKDIDLIDYVLKNAVLELKENKELNSIRDCGSGIQSAAYFAISVALSMDENSHYLVGIDEPELSMHPQAQKQLVESLKNVELYSRCQFVLTTHSTVMIDRIGHQSIALCRKIKGSTRDIVTTVSQTSIDFWEKYHLEEEKYYTFFDYKNSDFFFSNYIVISESPNDCKVIQKLLELSKIDTEEYGITMIPANGESNIKYPYAICNELGIPFVCSIDRDALQPYIYENKSNSLNDKGFYEYSNKLKTTASVSDLLNKKDKQLLSRLIDSNNYPGVRDLLLKYNIVIMRYAFELDLVSCPSYLNEICKYFDIGSENKLHYLVSHYGNQIKKSYYLNGAIEHAGIRNLPTSYKLIIKSVRNMISEKEV